MKAPVVVPQQRPSAPGIPGGRQWPVAFTPTYCECFAAQVYCDGCNCSNCGNNIENENMRKEAIETLLARNPLAFQPKIENGPSTLNVRKDNSGAVPLVPKHNKGCHCKKSGCLKKSPLANTIYSNEVKDLVTQMVTGCAMEAEAYTTISDNKVHETAGRNEFHTRDGLSNGHCKQQDVKEAQTLICNELNVNEMGSQWSDSSKDSRPASPATQALMCNEQDTTFGDDCGSSFPSISYNQDVPEIYVAQEGLVLTGLRDYLRVIITRGKINGESHWQLQYNKVHETAGRNEFHTRDGLSNGHCKQQDVKEAQTLICNELNVNEMGSQWSDSSKDSRPASPATQALMCNEQDTTFGDDCGSSFPSISYNQDVPEIYVAQEGLVLTGLRDYLRNTNHRQKQQLNMAHNWTMERHLPLLQQKQKKKKCLEVINNPDQMMDRKTIVEVKYD
ncbi:hypothetical protein PR202_ga07177 [Eleusine coracana subsp. coracana]|uniref:CRC domain-containing protein n=1 Tax=Eleusine coracana subsp. coracana TaxID=191504 RepID=A0AAV5BXY8_ELECO|nr:hypothetical protein PR202_ga07177 [Eleusine coracana subsp. coracana]